MKPNKVDITFRTRNIGGQTYVNISDLVIMAADLSNAQDEGFKVNAHSLLTAFINIQRKARG